MKLSVTRFFSVLCAVFGNGATAPYRPYDKFEGGYTDSYLGDDIFSVTVKGTGNAHAPTLYQHFRRRAHELIAENAYRKYEVLDCESTSLGRQDPTLHGRIKCYK